MEYIISTKCISKQFGGVSAVRNLNMNVKKGEIYGFLGPNGAGKTTTLKMILNLLKADEGKILLFSKEHVDYCEVFKRIGSMIDTPAFYERLTGKKNLEIHCEYMGFYDKKAIEDVLKTVGLSINESKKVKHYSLGMKQRLAIARAIVTRPELLILDEPINGLDPIGIKDMRNLFESLSREYGMTIIISSHIIGEIEQIADTIGVIDKGCLIKEVAIEKTKGEYSEYIQLVVDDTLKASYILDDKLKLSNFKIVDEHTIRVYDLRHKTTLISRTMILNHIEIEEISMKSLTLEDYFLSLINGGVSRV